MKERIEKEDFVPRQRRRDAKERPAAQAGREGTQAEQRLGFSHLVFWKLREKSRLESHVRLKVLLS